MSEQSISEMQENTVTNPVIGQDWFPMLNLEAELTGKLAGFTRLVVITDKPLKADEELISVKRGKDKGYYIVKEILDTREAKGDWSGEKWKGIKPLRVECTAGWMPVFKSKKEPDSKGPQGEGGIKQKNIMAGVM